MEEGGVDAVRFYLTYLTGHVVDLLRITYLIQPGARELLRPGLAGGLLYQAEPGHEGAGDEDDDHQNLQLLAGLYDVYHQVEYVNEKHGADETIYQDENIPSTHHAHEAGEYRCEHV